MTSSETLLPGEARGRAARKIVDEHIRTISSEDSMVLSLKALGAQPFLMVQAIRDFQAAQRQRVNQQRMRIKGTGKSAIVQRVLQREAVERRRAAEAAELAAQAAEWALQGRVIDRWYVARREKLHTKKGWQFWL